MKKLVIIPAFNESASIERAVDDIRQNAPGFDYIVINDCPPMIHWKYVGKMESNM